MSTVASSDWNRRREQFSSIVETTPFAAKAERAWRGKLLGSHGSDRLKVGEMSRKDQGKGMSRGMSLELQEKLTDELEARERAGQERTVRRRTRVPRLVPGTERPMRTRRQTD